MKKFLLHVFLLQCLMLSSAFTDFNGDVPNDSLLQAIEDYRLQALKLNNIKPDSANICIEKAIQLSLSIQSETKYAECLLSKSELHRKMYKIEDALLLIDSAFQIFTNHMDTVGIAKCYSQGALLYKNQGELTKAQKYFEQAILYAELMKDTSILIASHNNLGSVFMDIANYELSERYYNVCIKLAKLVNDTINILNATHNLGSSLAYKKDYTGALAIYQKNYEQVKHLPKSKFRYLSLINIADSHSEMGNFETAIKIGNDALDAIDNYGFDQLRKAIVYFTISNSYLKLGKLNDAKFILNKMCVLADELKLPFSQLNCFYISKEYYKLKQDYKLALDFTEKFQVLHDSILNPTVTSNVIRFKSKLDLENKEKEIESIQIQNQAESDTYKRKIRGMLMVFITIMSFVISAFLISRSKQAEKKALAQRNIIESKLSVMRSQMNPHFIFNAFTAVQNFVLKSEKMEAYKYLNKLASLLRQVVTIANDTYVLLEKEIDLLENYLELETLRFRKKLKYSIHVDDKLLDSNLFIPSMMIQPHIENAIIHGLSNNTSGGELAINFERHNNGLKCSVKDNGIGRTAAKQISQRNSKHHLNISSINGAKRLSFLKEIGYNQARLEIIDLYENDNACGTEVLIYLPFIKEDTI